MSNKQQLFENMGGNSFRIATPQAMGMMGETGVSSDRPSLELTRSGQEDDWNRPIYVDKTGKVYVDVNLGRGTPSIHSVSAQGEPEFPVKNFKIIGSSPKNQHTNALCPRCKNSNPELMQKTPDGKTSCKSCHWEDNPGMDEGGFSSGQSRGMATSNEPLDRPPLGNTPKMQDKVRLTIARKSETNEWLVKVYVNGKYSEDKTYYTDDKQDAIDTAKIMMGDFQKKGLTLVGKDGRPVAPIGEGRCEDYPCCGHEAGDCPDSEGRFTCVGCGKRLPRDAGSSICPKCQSRMSQDGYEDPTGQDSDY